MSLVPADNLPVQYCVLNVGCYEGVQVRGEQPSAGRPPEVAREVYSVPMILPIN